MLLHTIYILFLHTLFKLASPSSTNTLFTSAFKTTIMHSYTSTTSGAATLLFLSFGSSALAQLLGCDAVGCPLDDYRTPQCEVGNATLKAIGIANVTTLLDAQPLTWTLGLQELNGTQPTFDRNFYLGTPASLELNDTTGCALFFEGVSTNLTTSKGNLLDKFTCSDALAESCVSDLITQAESNSKDISGTSDDSDFCNKLRDSLVNKPPSTCNGLQGSWGNIIAKRNYLNSYSMFPKLTHHSSFQRLGRSPHRALSMPPNHGQRL